VHSPCSRLYIAAAVAISTTVSGVIRTWILSDRRAKHSATETCYGLVSVSVSVCLSVTSQCPVKRVERINLLFGMEAFFHQFYTVI